MGKIDQWNREEKEHRSKLRSVHPMSTRRPGWNKNAHQRCEKSPHPSRMTSHLLATTFRYKITTVAVLLKFFREGGENPSNISQVLRLGLESMEDMIVASNPQYSFTSEHEAFQFLQSSGLMEDVSPSNRKRLVNVLALENIRLDGFSSSESKFVDSEILKGALEHLKKLEAPPVQGKGPGKDGEYDNSEMKKILQQMRENNQQVGAAEDEIG